VSDTVAYWRLCDPYRGHSACQRTDWRQGILYSHKRICGRLLKQGDSETIERSRLEPASFVDLSYQDYEVREKTTHSRDTDVRSVEC
jgi:hypothetical protein